MNDSLTYLSLCGMLGYGYPPDSLRQGMEAGPEFIGVDNGSTDPGPYYLGSGRSFLEPAQIERDLRPALKAARQARIPLIIGSAGGSGARPHLEAFLEILRSIAARDGLRFRLAVIRADVDPESVLSALGEARVRPCGGSPPLTREAVRASVRIVGQMGVAPLIRALDGGADVVVAGRCCDAAVFAALPIRRGFDPGLALHAAKIAECGALCARPSGANDSLICTLEREHFTVRAANPGKRCTPESVAAHSLYEQPDPLEFLEPEGRVDMSGSRFDPVGGNAVRVAGTRFLPAPAATVKLEGARLRGWRSVAIAGIRDPVARARIAELEAGVRQAVAAYFGGIPGAKGYALRFLRYGFDGVAGDSEPGTSPPGREIGLVIEAMADSQDMADAVLSLARSTALHQHYPGRKATAGNLAFPFSPSDFRGGPVYEFSVYHILEPRPGEEIFPVAFEEVGS